jgi:hypothetical protein
MSAASTTFKNQSEQIHNRICAELTCIHARLKEYESLLSLIQPINSWEDVMTVNKAEGIHYYDQSRQFYTMDKTTGNFYKDDLNKTLRWKLFLLSLGTFTVNLAAVIVHSVVRLIKLVTLYEFLNPHNSWATAVKKYAQDLITLICSPLILACIQITAMLGTITPMKNGPKDARKIYGVGEAILFSNSNWRLANCFRSKPEKHYAAFDLEKKTREEWWDFEKNLKHDREKNESSKKHPINL